MRILNISDSKNISYKGELILTREKFWPEKIKSAVKDSIYISKLAEGERNVVARLSKYKVSSKDARNSIFYSQDEILYRISLSFVKNTFWSKLADKFNLLKRTNISNCFHRESGAIKCLDEEHFKKFFK